MPTDEMPAEPTENTPDKLWPGVKAGVSLMEQELGLAPGFLERTLHEDDWTFIIKIHALLEAVVAHLVLTTLHRPELEEIFAKMPLGGRTGKRAFAKSLGLLSDIQDAFIDQLSRIRNAFVHDPRNASADLARYLQSLPTDQRSNYATSVARALAGQNGADFSFQLDPAGPKQKIRDAVTSAPKVSIWFAMLLFIALTYVEHFHRTTLQRAILGLKQAVGSDSPQTQEK